MVNFAETKIGKRYEFSLITEPEGLKPYPVWAGLSFREFVKLHEAVVGYSVLEIE